MKFISAFFNTLLLLIILVAGVLSVVSIGSSIIKALF